MLQKAVALMPMSVKSEKLQNEVDTRLSIML